MITRLTGPRRLALLSLGVIVLLAGCEIRAGSETTLVLTGSSTVAPLMVEIARRYEELHPGWRIDVQTGGSSRGIADARSGLADIGMISRELAADERDLVSHPIARDGVAIIVHRDNPVAELSRGQILSIFRGEERSWKAFGGPKAEITVVTKAEGRATREVFLDYLGIPTTELYADTIIGHNEQGIQMVAGNPHAIGFVSLGAAELGAERGVPLRLLPIDGVAANLETLAAGEYPLMRGLNLVTHPEPREALRALIRYARSEEVHDLVRAQAFVPVQP